MKRVAQSAEAKQHAEEEKAMEIEERSKVRENGQERCHARFLLYFWYVYTTTLAF